MVRILHQITNIIEPWINERLETLVGIYAAAVKVCIYDIVHALTMRSAGAVRLRYSMSLPAAFYEQFAAGIFMSAGCMTAGWLQFSTNLYPVCTGLAN